MTSLRPIVVTASSGGTLRRSGVRWAAAVILTACGDGTGPRRVEPPPFIFVAGEENAAELVRWEEGVTTPLTSNAFADTDPHVAAERIVFTSNRDAGTEIYFATLDLTAPRRLTTTAAAVEDVEPALDPSGTQVAFVSTRSGVPRLWVTDTVGATPSAIATGSDPAVPERAPAWSPDGTRLAFTSSRAGESQVYVLPLAGGEVQRLTNEAAGAFEPAWNGNTEIVYVAGGVSRIKAVTVSSGLVRFLSPGGIAMDQPSCARGVCVGTVRSATDSWIGLVTRPGSTPLIAEMPSQSNGTAIP